MSLNSCNIFGRCRDRDTGRLTKISQLHRDLVGLGKIQSKFTRLKANKAFYLSLDPKFLDRYQEDLVFTSEEADSEPKLASFYEAASQVMPEVRLKDIRELLAKKFKEGIYQYDEAYERMTQFNRLMDGGTNFIGTLIPQPDGKYMFKVAINSIEEQNALILTIADRKTAETIIKQLENLGVGIAEGARSLYNSKNPEVLVKGLLGLITLRNGDKAAAYNIRSLATETGHVAIGMLGEDHKLYQRLKSVIEQHPEVVGKLLGNSEYESYKGIENETKEYMGHIVGAYLELWENIKPEGALKTAGILILRILDWIGSKLHFTNRDYYAALYDAKWAAYSIAKNFMGNNFQGNIANALADGGDVLYGDLDILQRNVEDVLKRFKEMLEDSKDFGYTVHKNYANIVHEESTAFLNLRASMQEYKQNSKDTGVLEQNIIEQLYIEVNAANILLRMGSFTVNELKQVIPLLEKVLNSNSLSLEEQAKAIKYAQQVYNLALQLLSYEDSWKYIENNEDIKDEFQRIFLNLKNALTYSSISTESGAEVNNNIEMVIQKARQKLALQFLTQINGNSFLTVGQHVYIKDWKLVRSAATAQSIQDIMDTNVTTSIIARMIDSMADSPDIVNQLIKQAVEEKRHEANVKTLDIKDRLFDLYRKLREEANLSDTRIFFEKDDDGELTGNIISERNWGEWEKRYQKEKKEMEDRWFESQKSWIHSKEEMYNNKMFLEAFSGWRKKWHEKNSVEITLKDDDGNELKYENGKPKRRWVPATRNDPKYSSEKADYYNEGYKKLSEENPKAIKWLDDYMKLKKELDAMLPEGSTNAIGIRAPLFMGTYTDRLVNTLQGGNKMKRVMGMSLRKFVLYNLASSPSDTEYGGENNTYNNNDLYDKDGSVIFSRAYSNAVCAADRVPIFGIRKLPHMDDLSTDLIHSTLAYAAMATSYDCLHGVAECALQVAEYREQVDRNSSVRSYTMLKMNTPTGYKRLVDYLQQCVYNNYNDPYLGKVVSQQKILKIARKMFGAVAGVGSLWMLGFNWHSAFTNAYTGFNEIWKEARSGEEFRRRDFLWAMAVYAASYCGGILLNICNIKSAPGSIIESHTKLDLFLRRFDVLHENERSFRDQHIMTKGYGLLRGYDFFSIAMLPYSVTDAWMQSMAFLACARTTKLKNKSTGEECSLYDAYTVVKEKGKLPRLELKGGLDNWTILDKNQQRLNKIISDKKARGEELSVAEIKAVYKPSAIGSNTPMTENDLIDPYIPFDLKLEANFKTRCAGINNRLHGVYNRGDGGAFLNMAIASMAASMKRYAIGLIDRRFSATRFDVRTGETRQGSTVTMATLLLDCFTAFSLDDESKIAKFIEYSKIPQIRQLLNVGGNLVCGLAKFFYITLFPSYGRFGVDLYLLKRGYSQNQISNVRRSFGDIFMPLFIKFVMSFLKPASPDDDDDDDTLYGSIHAELQKLVDALLDNKLTDTISDAFLSVYLTGVKASLAPFKLIGLNDITASDEDILTKEYLNNAVKKARKDPDAHAFDIKGILYYQLYRGLLELKAYEVIRPLSMFKEYEGLTDSMLPGITALYDITTLLGLIAQNVDEEQLENMPDKKRKSYVNGKEIYDRGENKGWYKWAKKALKSGPMRSLEMWYDGYASYEAMKHYKEPFNKDKYEEGVYFINRK